MIRPPGSLPTDPPQRYGAPSDFAAGLSRSTTIALLVSPVGLVVISVIRLLIISNYNATTASAIVSSGGYVDAFLGTIIPLIPTFIPFIALALLFFNRAVLGTLAVLATALISPTAASTTTVFGMIKRDWVRLNSANGLEKFLLVVLALAAGFLLLAEFAAIGFGDFFRTALVIVAIALIPIVLSLYPFPSSNQFYVDLIRQPWLPAEMITLNSGETVVGYVLKDDDTWLVVLSEENRNITYYHASDVSEVEICQLAHTRQMRPLITVTQAGANLSPPTPVCRESPKRQT